MRDLGCSAQARWQHGGPAMLVSPTRFRDLAHGEPPRPQGSGGTSSWEAEPGAEPKHNMCCAALIPFLFWSEARQEGEWAQNWDGAQERSGGWLDTYTDRSEVTRQQELRLLQPGCEIFFPHFLFCCFQPTGARWQSQQARAGRCFSRARDGSRSRRGPGAASHVWVS